MNVDTRSYSLSQELSNLICVRRLQRPLTEESISASTNLRELVDNQPKFLTTEGEEGEMAAYYEFKSLGDAIVTKDGQPIGYFQASPFLSADELERPLSDFVSRIPDDRVISADTPMLDAMEKMAGTYNRFFVLDGGKFIGTVGYRDLFKPAGTMCLFALMQELEVAALQLCRLFADKIWDSLPSDERLLKNGYRRPSRKVEAWERFKEKLEEGYYDSELTYVGEDGKRHIIPFEDEDRRQTRKRVLSYPIECTMFCDKKILIKACNLLIDWSHSELEKLFSTAEEIRNACAHPIGRPDHLINVISQQEFPKFIRDCRYLIDSIRLQTPKILGA